MKASRTTCAECRELIGGYILGALEPAEADLVRRHLADCAECASEYARLAAIPDLLDQAGATETAYERPPAALEEAVLDRFALEHRPDRPQRRRFRRRLGAAVRPLRRPLPAALAAGLAAAAITIALAVPGINGADRYTAPTSSAAGNTYRANLTGTSAVPAAHAFARLESVSTGTRVRLAVNGLRGRPDDLYELWCVRDDGTKISAGTFRVDANGHASVNLSSAAMLGDYHRLSIERRLQPPAAGPGTDVMAGQITF